MMETKDLFWVAFEDELEKTAISFSPFIRLLAKGRKWFRGAKSQVGKAVTPAKEWAGKATAPARARLARSAAGKWMGRHPRTARSLSFTGTALATGGAWSAGEIPFRKRREIIQILPEPMYGGRR